MGGGGGFAGSVVNGAQDFWGALQMGYATVGTDTGHQAHSMAAAWALNNLERLVNFGHMAVHRTAVTAKALTEDYYSQNVEHSYFAGCSRGGGHVPRPDTNWTARHRTGGAEVDWRNRDGAMR